MSRKGRELERLVSILEKGLASEDIVIKSPDYIIDTVTNDKREVDISIRQNIGTTEILTIVECRDRIATEDVTWIEQLVTKVKDIEASRVIAASSSRFSKGAKSKAQHYGIELRTIDEISNENLDNWVIPCSLITIAMHHNIIGMTLISDNPLFEETNIPFSPNTKYFKHSNGLLYSSNDFFNMIPDISSYFPSVDAIEQKKTETFRFDLRDKNIQFAVNTNWIKIDGIELIVELWNDVQDIPSTKMLTYSNEKERLVGVSKTPVTICEREFNLVTHTHQTENGQIVKSTLSPKKEHK